MAAKAYRNRVEASGEPGVCEGDPPTWAAWGDHSLYRLTRWPDRIEFGVRGAKGESAWVVFSRSGEDAWERELDFRAPLWGVDEAGRPVDLDGVAERAAIREVDGDPRPGRERFLRSADLSRPHKARTGGRPCEVCGGQIEAGGLYVERVRRQGGDNRRAHPECVAQAWREARGAGERGEA